MLRWLAALAHVVTDQKFAEQSHVRMVSMPLGYSYPEQEGILTPLGPRTADWFRQVVQEPARGIEFFSWWPEGVGAAFFLGRALCRMWQDVRWRTPESEGEGELLMDVHHDLERAYRLDPAAAIPWREWAEILEYLAEHFGYVEFQEGTNLESAIQARSRRRWAVRASAIAADRCTSRSRAAGRSPCRASWPRSGKQAARAGRRGAAAAACASRRGRSARARSRSRHATSSTSWNCRRATASSIATGRFRAGPSSAPTTIRARAAGTCKAIPRWTGRSRYAT